MLNRYLIASFLILPLVVMIIPSIKYWSDYRAEKRKKDRRKKADYNKAFFLLFVSGVLCMWISWIGGIVLLLSNRFYESLEAAITFTGKDLAIQIAGLSVFCLGTFLYNLTLFTARKYIQPAPSGTLSEHKVISNGSFRIVRHPLYISYFLIMLGLSLAFLIYWLIIPVLLIGIGIYPMAKAEEKVLMVQFGDDYRKYREKVGMLFPRRSRPGIKSLK